MTSATTSATSPTATTDALAIPKLIITRNFAAARERVFKSFTDADVLKEWFGPEGFTVPSAKVDFRVGGNYRITMRSPEDTDHTVVGIYREINEPDWLVFTWAWETGDMDDADTLVTLEFADDGDGTEMTLTHEGFPNEDLRDRHNEGWCSSFNCLDSVL
ncbi:MAG: SRPBCC domain-containing protein [Rhodospirillales bacterium]|nr:SRPBCC domain-containing protein [Rhodospirillales bacterium]